MRELLDAAPDAMVIVDEAGLIRLANRQAAELFGYPGAALVGKPVELLVPARYRDRHPAHRTGYTHDPKVRPMGMGLNLSARRRDGSEFPAEISLSPMRLGARRLTMAAVRDVTERVKAEEARRRVAEEANRLKSEFLATMSHELRTPLNGIIGFAELMHSGRVGPVSDEHREYLGDILVSARHLLQLINDVLDLAKVEAGKMEFRSEPVDPGALVRETVAALKPLADEKRIAVEAAVDPGLGRVRGDPGRLRQILYNFLSNAIKFTGEGGRVTVRAAARGREAYRLEVADTGIGIAAADLAKLFREFTQLDQGPARRSQGTGLGLALTKKLAEAMGGRVDVASEPGRGSRFGVVLPRAGVRPAGEP